MALFFRRAIMPVLLLALAAATLGLAACGGSDDEDSGSDEVISAINILDKAGLHAMDDSLNKDSTVPAGARTTVLHLQAVTLLTEWPDDLQAKSKTLAAVFAEFAKSLEGEKPDVKVAAAAATKAHDAQHDFSHEVWEHLQKEAGINTGSTGHTN